MGKGEMFGEAFACANNSPLPLSIETQTDSEIVFLNYKQIITNCATSCVFHNRLIENMVGILANKNIVLTKKIRHLAKRTTRDKLLSYLVEEAQKSGSKTFSIPFSRQELADYLCVERSAMSAELSKLRREGIIETTRSKFILLIDHHLD
jgi:CRP/FNR family transcriptional regulator, dissimilatory nitrate respiration regulator